MRETGSENQRSAGVTDDDSLLAHILLALVVVELAIHRVAVPALLPTREAPPRWHEILSWVGNFVFYFAIAFSLLVLIRELIGSIRREGGPPRPLRYVVVIGATLLVGMSLVALLTATSERTTFLLDGAFTIALIALAVSQLPAGGDVGTKIGLILLAVPLILHFYAPFALRYISGDDLGLPDRLQVFGQWSLVFSALATPYCFAPRPFAASAARMVPMAVALFVTALATIILRRAAEVGMDLARDGLGVVLDPLAPVSMLALYIMALAAVTWTLTSCLAARSESRRMIGVGLGLVLLGGYAFEWPLQYLVGFLGLALIAGAARSVVAEEARSDHRAAGGRRIPDTAWRAYVSALAEAIGRGLPGDAMPSQLTVAGDSNVSRTHLVWTANGIRLRLTLVRRDGRVMYVDYLAGDEPADRLEPAWTLWGRPPRPARAEHPAAPHSSASPRKSDHEAFDQRFQMRDDGEHFERLLGDADLRGRTLALIDGWIAYWPDQSLRFRVLPGIGARDEHPIPVREVSRARDGASDLIEPMMSLLDLLGAMSRRGLPPAAPTDEADAADDAGEG